MEAHSELLVRLYTQARSRAAELYGEQYLDSDRWVRSNGIPELAKSGDRAISRVLAATRCFR
jgi:acyl-homoserine-lactone acylase